MAAVKDELLHLGRTILHAYFEETNLGPLLAHLAPDVIWLGAGQEMLAEGRTAVTAIFEKGQDQLIPCRQSQERTLVRSLGDGLWLVQICSLVETDPSYKMYLQAYQRCAFCFRKNQAGDWEIAYLNHSMAYEAVRENELFAISQGIRNFRKLKTADPNLFTPQDKELMYQLIRKLFQPLSLFPRFSRAQAEFICPHPDTLAGWKNTGSAAPSWPMSLPKGPLPSIRYSRNISRANSRKNPGAGRKKPISEPPGGSSTAGILPRPLPWPSREKPAPRPSRQWNGRALAKKRPPGSDPP